MQNKGAIRTIAIIFALIFLYQLSFTLVTKRVEKKAEKFAEAEATKLANGNESQFNLLKDEKETYFLDSVSNTNVYNLLFKKFTYRDAKEREINLGLDLKGGMNVTLEVSVKDIVKALSGDSQDPTFLQAMELATKRARATSSPCSVKPTKKWTPTPVLLPFSCMNSRTKASPSTLPTATC